MVFRARFPVSVLISEKNIGADPNPLRSPRAHPHRAQAPRHHSRRRSPRRRSRKRRRRLDPPRPHRRPRQRLIGRCSRLRPPHGPRVDAVHAYPCTDRVQVVGETHGEFGERAAEYFYYACYVLDGFY